MRSMMVFIIMSLNLIIQSTLLQHFRIFDVLPNTTLVLIVVFSVLWGKNSGAIIGVLAGLLQDILLGSMVGVNALIYLVIGLMIGRLESNIFKENSLTPVFFTTLSTIMYHLLFALLMYVSRSQFNFLQIIQQIMVIETIYNALISILVYKLLYQLLNYSNFKLRVR